MDGRILRIYRRNETTREERLPPGAQGNIITLSYMRDIVRQDAAKRGLGNFARREIIGFDNQERQIGRAFEFASQGIEYRDETPGYETIADLWSCMYVLDPLKPVGDCAIKCVALATCLAYAGVFTTAWVPIGQLPGKDDFNHVYLGYIDSRGQKQYLDPTPDNARPSDEMPAIRKLWVPIFEN